MTRVLILKDRRTRLHAYEDALRRLGYDCLSREAEEARADTIRDAGADALVVDVEEPEDAHAGIRVIDQLRDDPEFEKFPIVLCTNADPPPDTVIRISLLDIPIVERPFDPDELGAAINFAIAGSIG